jgi:hypothetical protein
MGAELLSNPSHLPKAHPTTVRQIKFPPFKPVVQIRLRHEFQRQDGHTKAEAQSKPAGDEHTWPSSLA